MRWVGGGRGRKFKFKSEQRRTKLLHYSLFVRRVSQTVNKGVYVKKVQKRRIVRFLGIITRGPGMQRQSESTVYVLVAVGVAGVNGGSVSAGTGSVNLGKSAGEPATSEILAGGQGYCAV